MRLKDEAMGLDLYRTGAAYTVAEVAAYAGTSAATVRRWITGYEHRDRHMEPVFRDKPQAVLGRLSFLDLAEIVVAVRFTQRGGRLEKVRAARARLLHEYPDLRYPFASLRLKQIGGEILHVIDEEQGGAQLAYALSLGGKEGTQHVLPPLVEQAIDLFDHDPLDLLATRWYPHGKDVPVVIDPRFGGGRPTVDGRGITLTTVLKRFYDAEQDIDFIASDLDLDRETIEELIRTARPVATTLAQ